MVLGGGSFLLLCHYNFFSLLFHLFTIDSSFVGYAQNGRGEEALNLFSQMIRTGMQPDDLTFVSVFIVCASLTSLEEGSKAHALVIKHGFDSDLSVCNALITMHSKCGGIVDFWVYYLCVVMLGRSWKHESIQFDGS